MTINKKDKNILIKINYPTALIAILFLISTIFIPIINSEPLPPPNMPPYGAITNISPSPAVVGETVSLQGWAKDPENGTIYVTWYCGDGETETSQGTGWPYTFTDYHVYTTPDTYTINLHLRDMGGKTADYYETLIVTNDAPNTPSTPSGPTSLDIDVSGTFSTSATDNDGHQVQYRFDWDADGAHDYSTWTSLGASGHSGSMDHSWSISGTYTVKAQAKDEYGAESGWSSGLTVTVNDPNQPPVADANGPYYAEVDETIQLDGSGSYDTDGAITLFEWDLDDDGQYDDATGETPTYSWSTSGIHNIGLRVTDDDSATDTDSTTVDVNSPPTADANGPYYANIGEDISFDGTGSTDLDGTISSYLWDYGDGNSDTGPTPTYSYSYAGEFSVTLTVTDDDGSTDSDTSTAYINYNPVADAGGPYTAEPAEEVTLDGSDSTDSDGTIELYEWDLDNDGDYEKTGVTVTKTWYNDGDYLIRLRVTDDEGATDTDTANVNIESINEEPSVEITDPEDGAIISGIVTIQGTASDPNGDSDLDTIFVSIDGGEYSQATGTSDWSLDWNTETVEDGIHSIAAIAYDGDEYSNSYTINVEVKNTHEPGEPDLDCDGSLTWSDISPGALIQGEFTITNIGHEDSILYFEIDESPSWFDESWTFEYSDEEPNGLQYGEVLTVYVSGNAPDIKNDEFDGQIKVLNSEDSSDFDIIEVTLTTPRINLFHQLLYNFLQQYPILFKILSSFV